MPASLYLSQSLWQYSVTDPSSSPLYAGDSMGGISGTPVKETVPEVQIRKMPVHLPDTFSMTYLLPMTAVMIFISLPPFLIVLALFLEYFFNLLLSLINFC